MWLGAAALTAPAAAQSAPGDDIAAATTAAGVGAAPVGEDAADSVVAAMPEDLRAGHFLLYLGGGFAFIPDALVPAGVSQTNVDVGGSAQLQLGVGLNRFLVLGLDGALGRAAVASDSCAECRLTTFGVGLGLAFHPTQAFAFDPWIRYGLGYRISGRNFLPTLNDNVDSAAATESAFDFAKLSVGGDFYPDPLFGFGPYVALDLGVNRLADTPQVYGNVQLGLRLAFDPMRGGTVITPGATNVASAAR